MGVLFSNNNSLYFSSLGLTSAVNGITGSVTLYDTASGGTITTAFQSSLNYVSGSGMNNTIFGASFQPFSNNIVSLTTNSSRFIDIRLINSSTSTGHMAINAAGISNLMATLRVIRGPSTVISQSDLGSVATSGSGSTVTFPPSILSFLDLSPLSGAATYILEAQTVGNSVSITFQNVALFVRQI